MSTLNYHPCQPGYYQAGKNYLELNYSEDCCLGQYVCQMFEVDHPYEHHVRIIPDGCNDILLSFDGKKVNSWLSLTVPSSTEFQFQKANWLFGVRFYPGADYSIFPCKLPYGTQKPIELKDLLPDFEALENEFQRSMSFVRRHELMEDFLRLRLAENKKMVENSAIQAILSFCVRRLIDTSGNISIDELAASAGYGPRYLRQLFADYIGHSTKELATVIRMQKTLQHLLENPQKHLSDIAIHYGFSDHSHMNREFRRFLGITSSKIKETQLWNSVLKAEKNRIF